MQENVHTYIKYTSFFSPFPFIAPCCLSSSALFFWNFMDIWSPETCSDVHGHPHTFPLSFHNVAHTDPLDFNSGSASPWLISVVCCLFNPLLTPPLCRSPSFTSFCNKSQPTSAIRASLYLCFSSQTTMVAKIWLWKQRQRLCLFWAKEHSLCN